MIGKYCVVCAAIAIACAAQQRFDSADAAAQALIDAAGQHDSARLSTIFGPSAKGILTSGDPAQDRNEQTEFARLAGVRHQIQVSPLNPNRAVLTIGEEDWPFPVPIRRTTGKWAFDASETPVEMLARRIGANELDAIEICYGYVAAQEKYAYEDRDQDGLLEYAPHLRAAPGGKASLYWEGAGEPLIPKGLAMAEWDRTQKKPAKPYHGYYFRVLDAQGPNAPGGDHVYRVKNKLIGGFGLVAWPAEYGVTGIHTFIVNQEGVVYEKDIAPVPGKPALPVSLFDPDDSWKPVD